MIYYQTCAMKTSQSWIRVTYKIHVLGLGIAVSILILKIVSSKFLLTVKHVCILCIIVMYYIQFSTKPHIEQFGI